MSSNSQGTLDDYKQLVTPFLLIKLGSISKLKEIIDTYRPQPYFTFNLGNEEQVSQIGRAGSNNYI